MFLAQRNDYDCGPIAIVNYMQWLGYNWSRKDLPLLRYILNTTSLGSEYLSIAAALETLVPGLQLNFTRNTYGLLNYMKKGNPIILAYTYKLNEGKVVGHIMFCYYENGVIVTNYVKNKKKTKLSTKQFKQILQNSIERPAVIYLKV